MIHFRPAVEPAIAWVSPVILSGRQTRYEYEPQHFKYFVAAVCCLGLGLVILAIWTALAAVRTRRQLDATLAWKVEEVQQRNRTTLDRSEHPTLPDV